MSTGVPAGFSDWWAHLLAFWVQGAASQPLGSSLETRGVGVLTGGLPPVAPPPFGGRLQSAQVVLEDCQETRVFTLKPWWQVPPVVQECPVRVVQVDLGWIG